MTEIRTDKQPELKFVLDAFERSKNFYDPLRGKIRDLDNMYFSIPDKKRYSWQENVFIPATYKAIRTISARIMSMIFAIEPPFDLVPRGTVTEEARQGVKGYIGYQFEKSELYSKFFMFA